jgi:hypothetical protein
MRLIDYLEVRKLFDEEYKRKMQLVREGETHLDNMAEGFVGADKVIFELPDIEVEPTLRKLLNGEWVDTEEVQTAFGIDFATGMSLFELSREAVWNAPPLNGQKITTKFRLKAEPVKHGYWDDKPTGKYRNWQSWCSACGKHSGIGGIRSNQHKPYCPNCGAKMDGGNTE